MASPTPSTASKPPTAATVARRRAVALAGHTGDVGTALAGLRDDDPGVRASALGALRRAGALDPAILAAAAADPAPAVRRRAGEELAASGEATVPGWATARLDDPDPAVVEAAAFALGEVLGGTGSGAPSNPVTMLCRIARAHADPLAREAAVAALGAIGDPAGLDAILSATGDKPAIRRRAVLALAPFDGPEVTAALDRALADRDWQVRQAAEDLRMQE